VTIHRFTVEALRLSSLSPDSHAPGLDQRSSQKGQPIGHHFAQTGHEMGHHSAPMGHHFVEMGHQMGHHFAKMGHEGTPMDIKMVSHVVMVKR